MCITAVTVSLGILYTGYQLLKPLIEETVKEGLGGVRGDQEFYDFNPGSLHFLLRCLTDERFLEVLAHYESGKMKERLKEAFSRAGIEVNEMQVKIENMEEIDKTKAAIKRR